MHYFRKGHRKSKLRQTNSDGRTPCQLALPTVIQFWTVQLAIWDTKLCLVLCIDWWCLLFQGSPGAGGLPGKDGPAGAAVSSIYWSQYLLGFQLICWQL